MVKSKVYYADPGANSITDAALFNATILKVCRNTDVHKLTDGVPGALEYAFDASTMTISFDPNNPFYGSGMGRVNRTLLEKIFVKYKI